MAYGGLLVVVAAIAQCTRNSTNLIKCYVFIMVLVFLLGFGISVAGVLKKDKLIDIAIDKIP